MNATDLNVWVLRRIMAGERSAPNRVERTSAPHIRRCLRAGLARVEGDRLVLTDAGAERIRLQIDAEHAAAVRRGDA